MAHPIFAVRCPLCVANVHVGGGIFAKVDWPLADTATGAFEAVIPDAEERAVDAIRGLHPLHRGTLPVVDVACPECKGAFSIGLAIFVPSPEMLAATVFDPVAEAAPVMIEGDA